MTEGQRGEGGHEELRRTSGQMERRRWGRDGGKQMEKGGRAEGVGMEMAKVI